MIKYQLQCVNGDSFEGWFRSSDDFDAQAADGALICPICGVREVGKAIMAPAVVRGRKAVERQASSSREGAARIPPRGEAVARARAEIVEAAERARAYVEKNFDYVGDKFAEEARRIHYGETDPRCIYGEATGHEAKELS